MTWTNSPEKRALLIHAAAWAAISAALAAINLMQTPPEGQPARYWFQWPLFGWGIGVAAHGLGLWLKERGGQSPLLATEERRGFWVHLFAYVAVNALLVWVDFATSPGLNWAYWPMLGWGAGLAAHGYMVWRDYEAPAPSRSAPAAGSRRAVAKAAPASSARKSAAKASAKRKTGAAKKSPARKSSRSSRGPRGRSSRGRRRR